MDATQAAITEHLEFDRMCSTLEEFEHLPEVSVEGLTPEPAPDEEESRIDQLILAGLVSPV